jgi:hypothetical protein
MMNLHVALMIRANRKPRDSRRRLELIRLANALRLAAYGLMFGTGPYNNEAGP